MSSGVAATVDPILTTSDYRNSNGTVVPSTATGSIGSSTGKVVLAAGIQGTDGNVLSAGTVSGTGVSLCTDGNGGATTAGCSMNAGIIVNTNTPAWLQYLGSSATNNTNASGNMGGEYFYNNFMVPYGNTVNVNDVLAGGLTIHATGTCTIAGTINSNGQGSYSGVWGGSSGGSGGGTSAGTAGSASYALQGVTGVGFSTGGAAGSASGGNGGNGGLFNYAGSPSIPLSTGGGTDGLFWWGAKGLQGANSGGGAGIGAGSITLICGSIVGTDGTHTGIINAYGSPGAPSAANSTGAGSGGGGGVVILSSQAPVTTWPTISVSGGAGGLVTVPNAVGVGGSCTSQPKATLGVSGGALSGTCTVQQAGAGCGTGGNLSWTVQGGGGTLGTAVVNPTWSGGTLASCTVTPGTSSGYSAATYTTSGTGGDGGNGWSAEFQNW